MPFLALSAICLLDAFAVFFLVLTPTAMRSTNADVKENGAGEHVNRDEHPIPTPMSLTELHDKIKILVHFEGNV